MEKIANYIFLYLSAFAFSSCTDEIQETLDTAGDVDIHALASMVRVKLIMKTQQLQ